MNNNIVLPDEVRVYVEAQVMAGAYQNLVSQVEHMSENYSQLKAEMSEIAYQNY